MVFDLHEAIFYDFAFELFIIYNIWRLIFWGLYPNNSIY